MRFILGLITGLCLASVAANAGIISHYEMSEWQPFVAENCSTKDDNLAHLAQLKKV